MTAAQEIHQKRQQLKQIKSQQKDSVRLLKRLSQEVDLNQKQLLTLAEERRPDVYEKLNDLAVNRFLNDHKLSKVQVDEHVRQSREELERAKFTSFGRATNQNFGHGAPRPLSGHRQSR